MHYYITRSFVLCQILSRTRTQHEETSRPVTARVEKAEEPHYNTALVPSIPSSVPRPITSSQRLPPPRTASEQKTHQFLPSVPLRAWTESPAARPIPGQIRSNRQCADPLKITRSFDHTAQHTQLRPATPARTPASQLARPGTQGGLRGACGGR
jgi:hypothetical protein